MNPGQKPIHPQQDSIRAALRVVGPLIIAVGVVFTLVGAVDFFSKVGTSQMPTRFWCFFVGLPLLALGGSLTYLGWVGADKEKASPRQDEDRPLALVFHSLKGAPHPAFSKATEGIAEKGFRLCSTHHRMQKFPQFDCSEKNSL